MLSQSSLKAYWSPRCTGPWATVSLYGAGKVTVRPAIVSAVKALNTVLKAYKYATRYADTGAYNCRHTASGSWSLHAYGIAMDINWQSNPYSSRLRTDMFDYGDGRMPYRICAIRTNNGKQVFNWGGFWSGSKDSMHYEIVCSPSDLRTGINWSTVYGYGSSSPTPTPTPTPAPPTSSTGADLVFRIVSFKGKSSAQGFPDSVTGAIHRVQMTKCEVTNTYVPTFAWWLKTESEVDKWVNNGAKVESSARDVGITKSKYSTVFWNGPFKNADLG